MTTTFDTAAARPGVARQLTQSGGMIVAAVHWVRKSEVEWVRVDWGDLAAQHMRVAVQCMRVAVQCMRVAVQCMRVAVKCMRGRQREMHV